MTSQSSNEARPLLVDAPTEIRILSAFLGHAHINWKPDTLDDRGLSATVTEAQVKSSKPYFHIANLLNIQKEIVVAVTGTIGRNDTAPTIVYSTNSKSSAASDDENDVKPSSVKTRCPTRNEVTNILPLRFDEGGIPLEEYVSNLFSLFALCNAGHCGLRHILKWVTYHCWSKLHKRLRRVKQFQRGDLFELLANWKLSNDDIHGDGSGKNGPKITTETPISISEPLIASELLEIT
ncbi:hypothetical protein LXA43DRAFT_1132478 [Ganoderma leucocontextum]|nr:hypothetical protein LXA43DRAFT_1132478 [Ganoderma leucocontextum]